MRPHVLALLVPALAVPAAPGAWAGAEPGRVLAFVAARAATQAADPLVRLPLDGFDVRAGDVLEYRLRCDDPRPLRAGVELVFADGARLTASPTHALGGWAGMRVDLAAFAGRRALGVELAARGFASGEVAFGVDDLRVARADGSAIELFADALPGGVELVRDLARGAGCAVVRDDARLADGHATAPGDVGLPWAAFDLSGQRALQGDDAVLEPAPPRGLVWAGPCVPLRFADAGEARGSFAAGGQTVSLEPAAGGRYYELWLALANQGAEPVEARVVAIGARRERLEIPLRVPARGPDGYAPEGGFPARAFALLEVAVASPDSLVAVELPDDARLRVLAVTARWRRDGAVDPRFRRRFLAQAAARGDLDAQTAADLLRYLANRRAGEVFGEVDDADASERALFDARLAGDAATFQAVLAQRLALQDELAAQRKRGRIDLLATLVGGADEIAAALAAQGLDADAPVVGGLPADLEALERDDPPALARLAARAHAATWRTFGAPWRGGAAARLSAAGLARLVAAGQATTARLLGATSPLAWLDADVGRLRNLPVLLAPSDVTTVLLARGAARPGAQVRRWVAAGHAVDVVDPGLWLDGPLRFDPERWSGWAPGRADAAAPRPVLLACDAGADWAPETFGLARELQAAPLAPALRWVRAETLAAELRAPPPPLAQDPPAPLAPRTARAELAALAAVRAAELALARQAAVEALAAFDGAPESGADLPAAWRALLDAAGDEPEAVPAPARDVAARADRAAQERLGALRAAAPAPGAGVPLAVLDALPWPRRALVELADGDLRARDETGVALPSQPTAAGGVLVELDLAGLAPRALRVRTDARAPHASRAGGVVVDGWTLSNAACALAFDPRTGRVESLRALPQGADVLRAPGEALVWVGAGAREPIAELETFDVLERGPLRAVVRRTLQSPRARVVQEFALASGASWVEVTSRVERCDPAGEVVFELPLAHATDGALVAVPLGAAAIPPEPAALRPIDPWCAATDGALTTALLGDAGVACAWDDRTFRVTLGGAGDRAALGVLATAGGWKRAGLDAVALERAQRPVLRAHEDDGAAARTRTPFVQVARLEADGHRAVGDAAALGVLAVEPAAGRAVRVRLVELRGAPAKVELAFERPPFGAARVDLLGRSRADLRVDGRRVEVQVPAGACLTVVAELSP